MSLFINVWCSFFLSAICGIQGAILGHTDGLVKQEGSRLSALWVIPAAEVPHVAPIVLDRNFLLGRA